MEEEVIDTPETSDDGEEIDYKALVEQERAEKDKALADAKKWKDRAKSEYKKVNETKDTKWLDQESIQKMVNESVWVVKFYSENKDANQYQADIEALVAKGIERDKAFRYVVSEKDPSLLLDDAKKAQLNGNTALTGVPWGINGERNPNSMTNDEISALSDVEFNKIFPSAAEPKKFYSE